MKEQMTFSNILKCINKTYSYSKINVAIFLIHKSETDIILKIFIIQELECRLLLHGHSQNVLLFIIFKN